MTDQRARAMEIYETLNEMARVVDAYDFGLPLFGNEALVAYLEQALADERRRALEEAALAVRESCEACSGSGYGNIRRNPETGDFLDGDECEYCGRPMSAIRAKAHAGQEG